MRLLAPVASLEGAKKVLEAGADDIYFGAVSQYMENYSFNGRAAYSKAGRSILIKFDDIKEVVTFAHEHGARANYLANIPMLNDGMEYSNNTIIKSFKEYILAGIDAGVDSIVVGDLGGLEILRNMKISVPIVASSYLEVQNIKAIELLKELGVSKTILSYQIKLDEIIEIASKTSVKLEVFGHGGCSFYVGSCNLFHEVGESSSTGFNVGYPCRGNYIVSSNGNQILRSRFLDGFKMCSFCGLSKLVKAGVDTLKIVGRDLDPDFIANIIRVYRKGIDLASEGYDTKKYYKAIVPIWWNKMWCENGGYCRYM